MLYLQQFDLPASQFQNILKDTNKFCVIVEPRKHSLLGLVIKNFMYLCGYMSGYIGKFMQNYLLLYKLILFSNFV